MKIGKKEGLSFVLGLSNFIYFKSFAVIIFLEAIAVLFLIFRVIFVSKKIKPTLNRDRYFKRFYLFGSMWFVAQLFSDLINNANSTNTIKILAQIVVIMILIYWAMNWFQLEKSKLNAFLLGYCLSMVPNYFLTPNIFIQFEPWKFCFGPGFTMLLFLWYSKKRITLPVQILTIIPLTYLDILWGSRALALVTFISWVSCVLSRLIIAKKINVFISLLVLIIAGLLLSNVYHQMAISGSLGTYQQVKASQQFGSGPLILVARSELLYELSTIKKHILLGTGSNPNISSEISNEVYSLNLKLGIDLKKTAAYQYLNSTGKIPQHSLLFSFWMTGGILGALFWIYLFIMLSKWTIKTRIETAEYFYLSRFLYVGFLWNFLFSPLGAGQRVLLAITVATIFHDYSGKHSSKLQ